MMMRGLTVLALFTLATLLSFWLISELGSKVRELASRVMELASRVRELCFLLLAFLWELGFILRELGSRLRELNRALGTGRELGRELELGSCLVRERGRRSREHRGTRWPEGSMADLK